MKKMTVAKLIEMLNKFDGDTLVEVRKEGFRKGFIDVIDLDNCKIELEKFGLKGDQKDMAVIYVGE